jgi:succinoglycan biosynthesis transport protein ExoP
MNNQYRPDPLQRGKEFWTTVVLHWKGILFVSVILSAIAVVAIALLPDTYSASTTVLFDPQKLPEQYVAPTVNADPSQQLNTLTQEVLSAGRLQQIVQQAHLSDGSKASEQQVLAEMRKSILIDMKQGSGPSRDLTAFVITYTSDDAQQTAAVVNQLAQSFIEWDLANRELQAANTAKFMAGQLQEVKQSMDLEEAKLRDYKLQHSGTLPEQLQTNIQELALARTALQNNHESLTRLEEEKATLIAAPNGGHSATGTGQPSERDRLETERRTLQAELTSLRAQYTEQYPDVVTTKARLEDVTNQLNRLDSSAPSATSSTQVRLQAIQRQSDELLQEGKQLQRRIDKYQALVDTAPLRAEEFDDLNRNYNNVRDQYEGLLDKKFRAELAMDLEHQQKSSRFTVDPAQVPERPVKPNRSLLLALVLPVCLLIPTGISIASAELRGTVNSKQALRALLPDTARVLGDIPIIETPVDRRKRLRLAMLSILGSFLCCIAVASFLWGGTAAHARRKYAHHYAPVSPNAQLAPQ